MRIEDWAKSRGLQLQQVAEKLGISGGHIGDWISGRSWPGREMMKRVRDLTGGEVMPNDFLDVPNRRERGQKKDDQCADVSQYPRT
jgi:transcriptional regulator with XRE-family HTH domain